MNKYNSWRKECPKCHADLRDGQNATKLIHIVDCRKDCVAAYLCPVCGEQWERTMAEVLAVADPTAFKEIP